jgi:hypothetical protein
MHHGRYLLGKAKNRRPHRASLPKQASRAYVSNPIECLHLRGKTDGLRQMPRVEQNWFPLVRGAIREKHDSL